jgi:hypothetical protein
MPLLVCNVLQRFEQITNRPFDLKLSPLAHGHQYSSMTSRRYNMLQHARASVLHLTWQTAMISLC